MPEDTDVLELRARMGSALELWSTQLRQAREQLKGGHELAALSTLNDVQRRIEEQRQAVAL